MTSRVRYLEQFTSPDGLTVVTFPDDRYQWQTDQKLRAAFAPIAGGDYAIDLLSGQPASKESGSERLTVDAYEDTDGAIDALVDSLKADCYRIGVGKLWTVDAAGNRRWAWARLASMPGYTITVDTEFNVPVALEFTRLSDWFGETLNSHTETITASPHSFTITNRGNAPVQGVVARFRASGSLGNNLVTNPDFEVDTSGWGGSAGATVSRDTGTKHGGAASLKVTGDGVTLNQATFTGFDVSPSTPYLITAWIRLVGGANPLTFRLEEKNGATIIKDNDTTVTWRNDWQQVRAVLVTSPTTIHIALQIICPSTMTVFWVDDVYAGTPAGFVSPTLRNKSTGERFTVNQAAGSGNDEVRVDSGPRYACELSTDDGASYSDIGSALTIGDRQFNIITLQPGANQFEYSDSGAPNLDLLIQWMDTWH